MSWIETYNKNKTFSLTNFSQAKLTYFFFINLTDLNEMNKKLFWFEPLFNLKTNH